ncbi:DUF1090 domain-containing protein [Alcaligenes endophyticus]|uniref:DUF1090 domain-containing protein n=1 Tax=Alcaligenes endophyticus TaxID=1929088 RepID=A0ABT8EIY7_9BURK|nr:DUF1090 domain-containing protein [Alcaligenes endophyticus]MCX5592519.1 DUF1090 domain-containing protein [Alcaligenes endophyticus]MDN4121245.1 DUF1090 domain-containing protein [Alcaligenes endophyticus]
MKFNNLIMAALLAGLAIPAQAREVACQRKVDSIQRQLEHANRAGNYHRVRGLERALVSTKSNCTDAGLVTQKRKDIREQQEDIKEVQEEIEEKKREGRHDKVPRLERKLQREQDKLSQLQSELHDLES